MLPMGVEDSLKRIFTAIIVGGIKKDSPHLYEKKEVFRTAMPRFLGTFNHNIFENEYAFFYEVINTLRVKVFNANQLRSVLDQNTDLLETSPYIDLSRWANTIDGRQSTEDEKVEAFCMEVMDLFEEFSNDVVTIEEFDSACEIYIDYYKQKAMLETAQNMSLIMSDLGFTERKTKGRSITYKGVEDVQKYYNERLKIIKELSEENRIVASNIDADWLERELEKEDKPDEDAIINFGLPEIDDFIGSLRRSHMLGILGPPKGGKTRTSNYLVNRCLDAGLNVTVWPLEGSEEEWTAMQTAVLIRTSSGQSLDSKRIIERKYENDDIRQVVLAAKTRLATDVNRGRLSFIAGTAYVEDFIDVLQTHYDTENPFDVIVIDSIVNILSSTRKTKVERISEGYMLLKDFITNKHPRKALAILPAQLKQNAVDFLRSNPDETIDVTAGGESAETIRSPDEVIGVFSTKEERNAGQMKFYHVASRHSATFDDFTSRCELGCCFFYSDPSLNN